MKVACIDDVPSDGECILALTKNAFSKYAVNVRATDFFSSGDSFFRQWHPGMYRIVFLDIFLEKGSGIEIAKMIRKADPSVSIIFCSSSNEFASESYEVQANYYLVKPVSPNSICRMIHRLNLLKTDEDILELPDRRMILLSQFLYSDYHNHLITLHLKNSREEKIWSSQADFLQLLEPFRYFLSVTPGTVINLKEVTALENDIFRMSDGSMVPISRRKKKELERSYRDYLFSELRKES